MLGGRQSRNRPAPQTLKPAPLKPSSHWENVLRSIPLTFQSSGIPLQGSNTMQRHCNVLSVALGHWDSHHPDWVIRRAEEQTGSESRAIDVIPSGMRGHGSFHTPLHLPSQGRGLQNLCLLKQAACHRAQSLPGAFLVTHSLHRSCSQFQLDPHREVLQSLLPPNPTASMS